MLMIYLILVVVIGLIDGMSTPIKELPNAPDLIVGNEIILIWICY